MTADVPRLPGGWDEMDLGDDFDEPLPEDLLSSFEGEPCPRPSGQAESDL